MLAKSVVQVKRFDLDIIHSEKEQIIRKSGILASRASIAALTTATPPIASRLVEAAEGR